MLLQPSAFQSDRARLSLDEIRLDLKPLQDYLVRYFPKNHRCAFVRSATMDTEDSLVTWTEVGEISTIAVASIAGSTLFIPPNTTENQRQMTIS
jgi:hypothetical protein